VAERRERRVRWTLGAALLLLVVRLAAGDNPFHDGIAERIRDGDPIRSIDYATTYGWWMSLLAAFFVAGLLASCRRWLGPVAASASPQLAPRERGDLRWFVACVIVAMGAAAVLAATRLPHSLWGDEEWTVRRAIDGAYTLQDDGSVAFERVGWTETFFDYRKPSNHVGFTVLSRASLAGWRVLARPELEFVSESAVRLPAFAAGLGAVAAVAFLLRRLGMAGAGVLAAFALALHPWHLRYASEARGYALLVLLVPLSVLLLLRALERGSWPRWALYAVAQLFLVWTWPPMAFAVVVLNACALVGLWRAHGLGSVGREQALRWGVVSVSAGLVFLQLMLGALVQLGDYVERETLPFSAAWFQNLGAHLVAGVGWAPDRPEYVDLVERADAWPLLFPIWLLASLVAAGLGALRLARAGLGGRIALAVLGLPGPALVAWAVSRGTILNHWYLLFALPGLVALVAAGLSLLARGPRVARTAGVATCCVWLAAFALFTEPARSALRAGSLQPMRESVALTRADRDPNAEHNLRILTASIQREPSYYDPRVRLVRQPSELHELMASADAENVALFVNYGRPRLAARRVPELVSFVEREDLFEPVARLPGFEPRGVRLVYRYRPGSWQNEK